MSNFTQIIYNLIQVPTNINNEIHIISSKIHDDIQKINIEFKNKMLFDLLENYKELVFKINYSFNSYTKIISFLDEIQIRYDKQYYILQEQTKYLEEQNRYLKTENAFLKREIITVKNRLLKKNKGKFNTDLIPQLDS